MKKIVAILVLILFIKGFSQDKYFLGKTNYCTPQKQKSKESFETAISALPFPKYYGGFTNLMVKVVKEDPGYCDAYFMAGYLLRLQDMHKESLALYYVADSLSQNKAPIFKQNLAIQYMRFGLVEKARKKYEEMIKFFPDNPEGYYGVANTSVILADYDNGLERLKKAEELYKILGETRKDVKYMYGMFYCFKENYEQSLPYLDEVYSAYKKDDKYLSLYALAQIKVGKAKNDEKLIKKARKTYDKIIDKNSLEGISKKLKIEFS